MIQSMYYSFSIIHDTIRQAKNIVNFTNSNIPC